MVCTAMAGIINRIRHMQSLYVVGATLFPARYIKKAACCRLLLSKGGQFLFIQQAVQRTAIRFVISPLWLQCGGHEEQALYNRLAEHGL